MNKDIFFKLDSLINSDSIGVENSNSITIRTGDFFIKLVGMKSFFLEVAEKYYSDFIYEQKPADLELIIIEKTFNEEFFLALPKENEKMGYKGFELNERYLISSQFFCGGVKGNKGIFLLNLIDKNLWDVTLQNILQISGAWLANQNGGFLIHSLGVAKDEKSYLLYGPSGAGKSTASAMLDDFELMSDEMNMILPQGNTIRVCSVPYISGERRKDFSRKNSLRDFPLSASFSLVQSRQNRKNKLRLTETLQRMLPCIPYVHDYKTLRKEIFKNLPALLENILNYDLEFDLSGSMKCLVNDQEG
ncbi:MAG: hypothetical protein JXA60_03170 [Candidatus Coatesbacteria bacterium]|nr:hypothetical protein [Candidatus Coatesbacteria bacterium]